jgi:hypothetical protein
MSNQDFKKIARAICEKALGAELNLDQFYNQWPERANDSTFLKLVFEDLVNGISHTPGKIFKKEVDFEEWRNGDLGYEEILLDLVLLEFDKTDDELITARKKVKEEGPSSTSRKIIEDHVRHYFHML